MCMWKEEKRKQGKDKRESKKREKRKKLRRGGDIPVLKCLLAPESPSFTNSDATPKAMHFKATLTLSFRQLCFYNLYYTAANEFNQLLTES